MKKIADNSSFMAYHLVCIKSNTSGVTSGAGTAYPSGARHGTTPQVFNGVRVAQYVVFCQSVLCFIDHCLSFWLLHSLSFFDGRLLIKQTNKQYDMPYCHFCDCDIFG